MRISLDTNILWPVLSDPSGRGQALALALDGYNATHDLCICAHVYAELAAAPGAQITVIDTMLSRTGVEVDWVLPRHVWIAAGQAYGQYAHRRRTERPPTEPRRILADFLIGAHALYQTGALLTFNLSDFRTNFPTLNVIVPTMENAEPKNAEPPA